MTSVPARLDGRRVLILEDDYYLATDMQDAMEAAGPQIIGPYAEVSEACLALEKTRPDCAFVDVNLGLGPSFEFPSELLRMNLPFAFVTGYDADVIPAEFDAIERLQKPIDANKVAEIAAHLLGGDRAGRH